MAPRRLVPVAVLLLAVPGCALVRPGPTPIDDGITVLARLQDADARTPGDEEVVADLVVEIAYDEQAARTAWAESGGDELPERSGEPREAGRYGSIEDLDLREEALVVYSSGQSGSCPGWPADISVDGDVLEVEETEHVAGDGCNDSFVPYRLVLAVDREKLPAAGDLPLRTAREGDREHAALVTTYPAAR